LLAEHLDEALGIEIEEVAQEVVGRLRLDAIGQRREVLEVSPS